MQERTAASPSHTAYAIANAHALKVLALARARALALNMHQHERSTCANTCCTPERAWVLALKLLTLRLVTVQACMACRLLASMPLKH
jgi:hypothetical protein